jgi:hypothetical protein
MLMGARYVVLYYPGVHLVFIGFKYLATKEYNIELINNTYL